MLSTLELCAGAGGQALGFEQAGFTAAALIDLHAHSCATLRINRPYWNVLEVDLNRFHAEYWRGVDVVSAGLPCPPFSVAGQRMGADDERDLFPSLLRIVGEVAPRAVMVENVPGLLSRRFEGYREHIQRALEQMGYSVGWRVLDAHNYGTPQHRNRCFLVATGGARDFEWPQPLVMGATVGEAIFDLIALDGWTRAEEWAARANQPAPTIIGGSYKHGGPDLGPTRSRAAWAALGVDGMSLANAPPPRDFDGMPRLTVEMTSRLQSFPDDWTFAGGKTQRYRQIGNALPVGLAKAMAGAIARCLE